MISESSELGWRRRVELSFTYIPVPTSSDLFEKKVNIDSLAPMRAWYILIYRVDIYFFSFQN